MNSIDISEILPERTKYGFKIEKEIIKDNLFVSYKTQGRHVKSILPRRIILNEDFFIGLGLSVGDGLNNPSIKNTHYNFANSNFYLVKIVSNWLEEFFNVQPSKLQFFIHSKRNNDAKNSINNVTKIFNLSSNNIKVYFTDRHSRDVLTIQMSNPIFQLIYCKLFDNLKPVIIANTAFRRSFLKGLFAAEGHIKHSIYGTIEHIDFSFNPQNEASLAKFIKECLGMEGIQANIDKEIVYFCGYENMLKFYMIGILDMHKDKKEKFVSLCKNANIIAHFNSDLLDKLRNKISQRKLSKHLGCSQSCLSKSYKKRHLSIMNLSKILNYLEINKEKLSHYISHLTVSNTKITNRESIEFLIFNKLSSLK